MMLVGGQLAESQCLADDGAPSWMKPLTWTNPESSNTDTAPPALPQVKSPYLKPLRMRADVKVPQQEADFTANELSFENGLASVPLGQPRGRCQRKPPSSR